MDSKDAELQRLLKLADKHRRKGELDQCIAVCKDIISRRKENAEACGYAHALMGDVYLSKRELELAEDSLKQGMSYEPLNPEFHYLLGFVYSVSNQWDKAITEFELSVKAKPTDSEYLRGLGWALWSGGKREEGLKYLEQAVALKPRNVRALTDLAAAHLTNKSFEEALKYVEKALEVDPKNEMARYVYNGVMHFQPKANRVPAISAQTSIYQMKVRLKWIKPPIWRRFKVSGSASLYKLHMVLQTVMGWSDSHLYEFNIRGQSFGDPDPEYDPPMNNANRAELRDVLTSEKLRFTYIYDFGDGWEHEILVEKILSAEERLRHPVCLGGKRACPPEDCGGVGGYGELLEIIGNPDHEEYEERMEWLGDGFDPELFEIDLVNYELRRIR